jgi:negative regulator of flagellin synthesis FlgM|tara:strand:- start:1400 stop:1705 length:306 start_codon:yes stop_codon:yes gene_type:complete
MAINISNLNSNNQVKPKSDQHSDVKQQVSTNTEQVRRTNQDSVSITPQAKELNELQKKAGTEPSINQQKIEQIQKAIAAGDYKINPDRLAASIANFEFDLL